MNLTAQKREVFGKAARKLRDGGLVPAELYGKGVENIHLSVTGKEFSKIFKEAGSNTVIQLEVEGQKYPVVIHDVQRGFVSNEVEHVDFYKVRMDEKMKARIPLEFVGESHAVKALGATLTKSMNEIEVEALPTDLPHRLSVDISALDEIGKTIYVKDIAVPRGVEILVDMEAAVATVSERKEEVVEAAPVDVAAVKVESEEKKEERAAKKTGEEEAGA